MNLSAAISVLLASACATPILAQSLPGNPVLSGWIELEQVFGGFGDERFLAADVTLKLRPAAMNGFGFDLGVKGVQTQDISFSALYATVVMPLAGGELSFGMPRSALREIFGSRPMAGGQAADLELGILSQADYLTTVDLMIGLDTYGLRYDNTYGALRVSAGLYKVDDADAAQVAVEYALSDTKLRFGVETLSNDFETVTNLVLGGSQTLGKLELTGVLRHLDSGMFAADTFRLDADYRVTDAVTVSASYLTASEAMDDFYGLSADYTFTKTAYVQAGVLMVGSDNLYDVSLGVKF